ncbi:phospholipase D family protein [Pseudomonas sp. J452]|uniref:phospholipase D family protein n=1 Tax=Pseudomonas sp. J452 TaxID=2898441 RepID=UPI0021AD6403|nr:phospholipase D family protein [Pseudomonas sp. J452]UUY07731.1 phospholipase D family protein [Pseudomonas sp. J452]
MKLVTAGSAFKAHLKRLISDYPNIAFGVAWASAGTEPFDLLNKHKSKVKIGVIGIHFYQTHPDVLDVYIGSQAVKFVLQPKGVFHPKIYLFWDESRWEAIIGSANLTHGAMTANTELGTLLSHEDGDHLQDIRALLECYSSQAKSITQDDANNYRSLWVAKKPDRERLLDQYGDKPAKKSAVESVVMGMDWPTFLKRIKQDKTHGFNERLKLLYRMQREFATTPHFKDMDEQVRRGIAGIHNTAIENSAWFGSMIGAGKFKNVIISNHPAISSALDEIPLTGTVTKSQYDAYISEFITAFPDGRDGIGTATRLLSMKRPDQFLCVDSANLNKLSKDVGFIKSNLGYERYWNEVALRIMDAPWWKSAPPPKSPEDLKAWKGRAAMLDAIFYEEK